MPSDGRRAVWKQKRGTIARLRPHRLTDDELQSRVELRRDRRLRLCYAPTDYIRRNARLVVIGLTPDMHTLRTSVAVAGDALRAGASDAVALRRVKQVAPFSDRGTRRRLIRWLDGLGVAHWLGLGTCAELYEVPAAALVHWTSLVCYPAFRWDARKACWINYDGRYDPLEHFSDVIGRAFVPELRQVKAQLVFTCGVKVDAACNRLADEGLLDTTRIVALPHPSGANVGNEDKYAASRLRLRRKVRRILGQQP
jgi:hypothetical protein